MKGKLIFKTEEQSGKVCALLNDISHATEDKRNINFYTSGKALFYEIFNEEEQKKYDKALKKLRKRSK